MSHVSRMKALLAASLIVAVFGTARGHAAEGAPPAGAAAKSAAQALGIAPASSNAADFLPPDRAFRVFGEPAGSDRVRLTWEIARKIRAPEDEDEYETYSQNFGPRGASAIVMVLVAGMGALAVYFAWKAGLGWIPVGLFGAAAALVELRILWFVAKTASKRAGFKPVIEFLMMVLHIGFFVSLLVQYKVQWSF